MDWPPVGTFEPNDALAAPVAMLRRPFSLAGRRDRDGVTEIDIIARAVGVGTTWLNERVPGDTVHVLGPLGNTFQLPSTGGIALLVGGGVGIPPMIYLAERIARDLTGDNAPSRKAIAFCGATTLDLMALTITNDAVPSTAAQGPQALYNVAEFARYNVPTLLTTDDGSLGIKGYVTDALEAYLGAYFPDTFASGSVRPVIYTCGPEIMMKKVADIAVRRGLQCQVAVERAMACGMGTCQSCCIRVKNAESNYNLPTGEPFVYRLACTDGPVFAGTDLLW